MLGVPVAVLPLFSIDQWFNARRVADLGAGIALPGGDSGAQRGVFDLPAPETICALPAAVQRLLDDPRYRMSAGRLAADAASLPPIASAARLLETIAAARVPTPA